MRDTDVRAAVRKELNARHANDPDTRIVEEMGIWSGSVRIDVAVINGELSGFELKSDRDTLDRLPFQADLYSRVFDRVHLVVGARHAEKAAALVPSWWGVIIARQQDRGIQLEQDRHGSENPAPEPFLIAQLLWKQEAVLVLDRHGLAGGWRSKRIKLIHQRLSDCLDLQTLKNEVRAALKMRANWLGQVGPNAFDVATHADLDPML